MILEKNQIQFKCIYDKLHNNFFYSTLCYTCKEIGNIVKLCKGCGMISYCGREHQIKHWPEHKDFCKAVQYVRETYKSELSACEKSVMMEFLKEKVTNKLGRSLKLYELKMFKFPKICFICYKTIELERCLKCKAVWLCAQHKNNHDSNTCNLLKLCILTDLLEIKYSPWLEGTISKISSFEKEFSNMKEFIISLFGTINSFLQIPRELIEINLSTYFTKPLTVIYGMRLLDYFPMYKENKTELVLYIIAAHISDIKTLREWEILLHMFPTLKCLKLVLIGPEVLYIKKQPVCDICNQQEKIFILEWREATYVEHAQLYQSSNIPDLVIRFYMDNYYDEYYETLQSIWKSSLKYIAQHNCPFLFCYSRENNNIDAIINTEFGKTIEYRHYKNPFASLKPCRKLYDDDDDDSEYSVHYDNRYINVYKSLRQ